VVWIFEDTPYLLPEPLYIATLIMKKKNKNLTAAVSSAPTGFLRRSSRLLKSTMPPAMPVTPHKDDLDET
jgi:hypothetical protein